MATPHDADLIIKLYDLRRDETMRKARNYFAFEFFPKSVDEVKEILNNIKEYPEQNAYFRQVISYWEMVAAMVNHGSIDQALLDRKSTRLNSSHLGISYAVFCLKKKKSHKEDKKDRAEDNAHRCDVLLQGLMSRA